MLNMNIKEIVSSMSLSEKCYLLSGRDFWSTRSVERLGVPGITLSDGPHGVRRQIAAGDHLGLNPSFPATCFPTAATVANSWDVSLGEKIGECLGEEAADQGVAVLLGPGLNIKRNPLCGRNFEYYSEDPYLSGKMAAAYVRGIQSNGVAACPKHFAVNSQELRRMASDSVVDERTLRELYLTGFEIAVKEGQAKVLMSSYNRINGVYANENEYLLQKILREEWGFDGFVVSDWGASNDHVRGVAAGSHLEMPGTGGDSDEELIQAVKDGKIKEELIDQRVEELLTVMLPLHETISRAKGRKFDEEAHHELARKAAEESIVLLKNDHKVLPLKPGTRVAVIGDFARMPRYQGAGSSVVNPTKLEAALDVIGQFPLELAGFAPGYRRSGKADPEYEREATALAKKAEAVLLYIGLDEISESEGMDRSHMSIPQNQISLLKKISAVNSHVIAVISGGSAIEMDWIDQCEAILHGYLGGQAGASAMLRVITGQVNPSGKLNETYPMKYSDTPSAPYFPSKERNAEYREGLYVGYRYFETVKKPVRFPFGFGMSYTEFAYSDLKVSEKEAAFMLTNTGNVDGTEVAQLYVSAECRGVYRPAKELKGFAKVFLKAGETKKVTISLDDKAFRYYNTDTGKYEAEAGRYQILIGASCADIRLSGSVSIQGTKAPLPKNEDKLPSYATGNICRISDEEFRVLLGHEIPDGHWGGRLDENDAICQMYYAKSRLARLICRIMTDKLEKSMKKGVPNLDIMFIYYMPFRGIAKMTGGMCSREMVGGILEVVNGHFCKGIKKIVQGFFRQRKFKKS